MAAAAARLHEVERARLVGRHDLAVGDDAAGRARRHRPLRRHDARPGKLVFFNGHGGNSSLFGVANREVRLPHGLKTFLAHPGVPPDQGGPSAPEELGMGVHGGTDETSMMLHLAPDLVDMSRAVRNVPEQLAANRYVRFGGKVGFGWLSNDFGPDGHIGDPTTATAERGAALFEAAVVAFCRGAGRDRRLRLRSTAA